MSVNLVPAVLTHDTDLVQLPVILPRVRCRDKIPQTHGAERHETEVDPIQKGPGHLHCEKYGCWHHKEEHNDQNQQDEEVDQGGRPVPHAQTLEAADGSDDQRIKQLLDTDGQHQHGEGDADQSVQDGEGLSGGRQRTRVSVTWTRIVEEKRGKTKQRQRWLLKCC